MKRISAQILPYWNILYQVSKEEILETHLEIHVAVQQVFFGQITPLLPICTW